MRGIMAEKLRRRSLLPLVGDAAHHHAVRMLMITCPTTRTRVPTPLSAVRTLINHPDHIALHVTCPACGDEHVHRTGRRREQARRDAALEVAVRRAESPVPA
jgi:predicted RNA-binding Zn-ribbon protein involved in translation (DUF1610 family)